MPLLTHWDGEPVAVWARVWKAPLVEAHDTLGSTNDRLKELCAAGAAPWTVVVSDAQTAGRGREGAAWHSPSGAGLWISVCLPGSGTVPTLLPLLVGVAAARAAERAAPGARVGIKWPNDLEVEGRKLGGILCEGSHGVVIAGIGVNLRPPAGGLPDDVGARAAFLEEAGQGRVSLGTLATGLLHELQAVVRRPGAELDDVVHRELTERDVLRGRPVWTHQAGEGVARGIAADGALRLEQADGNEVRVVAGSVRISKEG